jgi:hypothetical protein
MAASLKYPIRWLTFQQRVRADLVDTFQAAKAAGDPTFFTETYLASLAAPLKQLEETTIKLFLFQAAILGFLAVGFVSPETKLSVFGFDLKNVDGLREILLAISATIALGIFGLASSRDTTIFMLTVICEQTQPQLTLPYAKYALPSAFNLRMYLPREYDRWMFPRFPKKTFAVTIALLCLTMVGIVIVASFAIHWSLIVASFAIHWSLIKEIWRHPGLGNWSIAALVYVFASYFVNLCFLMNRWLPLPYLDQSQLRNGRKSK